MNIGNHKKLGKILDEMSNGLNEIFTDQEALKKAERLYKQVSFVPMEVLLRRFLI